MKKVLVFGVFDGIHDGHRSLFKQAKKHGDYLIAAIAQDHVVEQLKGRLPRINLADRIGHLQAEDRVDEVVLGDAESGTYEVVKKYRPDIIALGYDQDELKKDIIAHLREFDWKPKIITTGAYEPNTHHSRLLRSK